MPGCQVGKMMVDEEATTGAEVDAWHMDGLCLLSPKHVGMGLSSRGEWIMWQTGRCLGKRVRAQIAETIGKVR